MARAFAESVRETLQPLSLAITFSVAALAAVALRVPYAGGWLIAALLTCGAWFFQELIHQSGLAMSGTSEEAPEVPLLRTLAVRLPLSILGAAVVLAPFVIRNGGAAQPSGPPLLGIWAVAIAFVVWWVVMPLVLVTANAHDRRGAISPRRVWATLRTRPRGTLAALLVVPIGLLAVELSLALVTLEQGHFPLLLNNVFPTPSTAHKARTQRLVYQYDQSVWNIPFTDNGLDLVPVYLSGLRRGFTLLGEVPSSLLVRTTRFDPTIYQTHSSVFLALRFVLAILGLAGAACVLMIQARCLGRVVAAGVEAEIAASARTGLVALPTIADAVSPKTAGYPVMTQARPAPTPITPGAVAADTAAAAARTGLIPIPPLPPSPVAAPVPTRSEASDTLRTAGHPSVLIIDDEPSFSQALSHILSDEGFTVHTAISGRDGLQIAAAIRPDLVILDVLLPDQSGLDVCRALRAQDATRTIPILMLSYRGGAEDEVSGLNQGADDYVTKPYVVEVLIARIRKQLRHVKNGARPPEAKGFESTSPRALAAVHDGFVA